MTYNDSLKLKHEEKRNATILEIEKAISMIKAFEGERAEITPKKIMNYAEVSRAVLYKKHILKLWNPELYDLHYEKRSKIERKLKDNYDKDIHELKNEIEKLSSLLLKRESEKTSLKEQLVKEKQRSSVYRQDIDEWKEKYHKVLGEVHRLQEKLAEHGIY